MSGAAAGPLRRGNTACSPEWRWERAAPPATFLSTSEERCSQSIATPALQFRKIANDKAQEDWQVICFGQ